MVTIHDVAKKAGVSNSTVSNMLNGRSDHMSASTLARIRAAIDELGYSPNYAARSLKTGRSTLIGLLVPSTANPWFGEIAAYIEDVARRNYDCRLLLASTQRDSSSEANFIGDLQSFGVRGLIVMSALEDESHLWQAARKGLPIVSYDRRAVSDGVSLIDHMTVDNFKTGEMATRHLLELGHRRLAFAGLKQRTMDRTDRMQGFLATAAAAGAEARVFEACAASGFGDTEWQELGDRLAEDLVRSGPAVTGVITVNAMLAISLVVGLRKRRIDVPRDISIVGIDGMSLSAQFNPAITSIQLPLEKIAEAMVDRIVARSRDPSIPAAEFIYQPALICRESTMRCVDPGSPS